MRSLHRAADLSGHFFHQRIALRMHRARIQRMRGVADAQESCGLLKGLVAEPWHLHEIFAALERAVLIAEGHDVRRVGAVQAGNVAEKLLAGRVQLHADAVHRADHHMIEARLELVLIHVVLILAHADRLRIELHQLRQRVHETTGDGNGAAHRHILVGNSSRATSLAL
jgi:hypothetical protein